MRRIWRWQNSKSLKFLYLGMARTKNTERLASNPFRKVNAQAHGVELLDVDKVRQMCIEKGKNAHLSI